MLPPPTPSACAARPRRGFTLVELALAVAVLALAISTAITVIQRAFLNLDTARNFELASQILQCELEKERLLSWTRVSTNFQPTIDASLLRNPAVAGRFTLSRTVSAIAGRAGQMVQVTLTVTWQTYDGRALARSHTTYIAAGGLYNYFYNHV